MVGVVERVVGDPLAYDRQWESCCVVDGSGEHVHRRPVGDGDLQDDLGFSSGDSYRVGDSAWASRSDTHTDIVR